MNMNSHKLCYVLPEYSPDSHTHFAYIADFLKEAGKEADIFLIIERGRKPDFGFGCRKVFVAGGFGLWRIFKTKLLILYARMSGHKDFYIHYSFLSAFIASCAVRIFGGRVFYWNCGLPWNYKRNFLREGFERLTYKMISFLVTGTEGLKNQYSEHYGLKLEKIKVMPNWIDLNNIKDQISAAGKEELKNQLGIKSGQKIILFIHRLSKRKGAHYLPEILEKLKNKNVSLIIVGDGPERKELEIKIEKLGLKDRAKFLGWLPHDVVEDYFGIADVFIMPSEEEGFPHVLLEAMAAGTPFVAFSVGGTEEITPTELKNDIIASSGDINGFILKAGNFLDLDLNQAKRIKTIEQQWVKRYNIKEVAQIFKSLFYGG
ncbi:MAG: glycosyltransferase family 4 protein [Candidatus Pacebacteria bacterium]|nr:glycosyltransferase family 4 protein [Candidatus Paceibacterota bacterium]